MSKTPPPSALVHSSETFGTVDGPGIRYVLFLQGCKLACKYCHNKDACTFNAGTRMEAEDIIKHVKRYREYLIASHGGVTVSGGEPLLQPNFLEYFFRRLGEYNIHRAIDTAGAVEITDEIKKVLKLTDLVLLDIKHINDQKCIELTGKSNKQTIEFARFLSMNDIPIWIRQVIVPGITDDEKDLIDLRKFIQTLNNVQNIELLPYHNMGEHKWKELGIKYPLKGVREANSDDITRARAILNEGLLK